MRCGSAGIDITPEPGHVLQGHLNDNPSTEIIAPLEVRSAVFEQDGTRIALITADVIGVPLDVTHQIRARIDEQCDIPAEHIMIAASHTHCAPATLPSLGMTPDPAYMQRIVDACVNATVKAVEELHDVRFVVATGDVNFTINRRPIDEHGKVNGMAPYEAGLVDRRVRVLAAIREDDRPVATFFHFATHPTSLPGSLGRISPDYPGIARSQIEAKLGGHALFLPGCFGNQRVAVLSDTGSFRAATEEDLRGYGRTLGEEVCRIVRRGRAVEATSIGGKTLSVDMPYGAADSDEVMHGRLDNAEGLSRLVFENWTAGVRAMVKEGGIPASRATEMQAMRIGPIQLVSIPGEPALEIGFALEKQYRTAGDWEEIWAIGYTNDCIGYLNTPEMVQRGGYEPQAYPYYGDPAPYVDEVPTILNAAGQLISS